MLTESRLTITADDVGRNKHGQVLARATCSCGKVKVLEASRVRTGRVKSCGCLKTEVHRDRWREYRSFSFPARLKETEAGCLEWQGPVDATGYGHVGYEGKVWRTHRLAWRLSSGRDIPDRLFVLHNCDNRRCCNPEHLRLGTHLDNMRDVVERGRRKAINAGELNGRAKHTQSQANAIRRLYASNRWSQEVLALQFGVSQWAVSMIVRNKRYLP